LRESSWKNPSSRPDAAHHLRGHGEEVVPALPVHPGDIDQPQVRLVDERGGLEGMVRALVAHVAVRDPSKFRVDKG